NTCNAIETMGIQTEAPAEDDPRAGFPAIILRLRAAIRLQASAAPTAAVRGERWHGWLIAICCALIATTAAAADARNVLVLYSNGRLVPANVDIERGLKSAIVNSPGRPVEIFSEFLDYPEFVGEEYESTVATYLRDKYAKRPPDIIIAV